MNTTISDTALRQAAQRLAYQLSAALPVEDIGFSADFEARMDPLLRREKRRRTAGCCAGLRRGAGGQPRSAGRGRPMAPPDDHGGHRLSVPGLTKRRSMDGERPDMASGGICNDI